MLTTLLHQARVALIFLAAPALVVRFAQLAAQMQRGFVTDVFLYDCLPVVVAVLQTLTGRKRGVLFAELLLGLLQAVPNRI
ncbi:MAG: hypothetical protein EOO73_05555 [Myxococcales bacterium]|nr:MAG: hypothetical protein EOO73_05555 [Myxococcales bacterium]